MDSTQPGDSDALGRSISWAILGNGAFALSQWLVLAIMVRLTTPEEVGTFSLGLAIGAPVVLLFNLGLRTAQASDVTGKFSFEGYLSLRLKTTLASVLAILAIASMGAYAEATVAVIGTVALAKGFEAVSDITYGFFQLRESMNLVARSLLARGALGVAFTYAALIWSRKILPGVMALGLSWLLVLLLHDLPAARRMNGPPPTDLRQQAGSWSLLMISAPIGIGAFLNSLGTNIPRYFVEASEGPGALGYFSAIAYAMVAVGLVANAVGQAAVPRLAAHVASREIGAFKSLLLKMGVGAALLTAIITSIAGFWGGEILSILYGQDYARHDTAFFVLMLAAGIGLLSAVPQFGLIGLRRFGALPILFGVSAVIGLCLAPSLIGRFQLVGAAWVLFIEMAVQGIGGLVLLMRKVRAISEAERNHQ